MDAEDVALRDLLRDAGLTQAQKRALVDQVRANIYGDGLSFPTKPHLYVERVKSLSLTALFPQSGPLVVQRIPEGGATLVGAPINLGRAEAWKLLHDEFNGFAGAGRPLTEIRGVMIEVVGMVIRSDLPLDLPPRRIAQLMLWIQKLTGIHNEHLRLTLEIPADIDPEGRAYLEAVLTNIGNARWTYKQGMGVCSPTLCRMFRFRENYLPRRWTSVRCYRYRLPQLKTNRFRSAFVLNRKTWKWVSGVRNARR